MKPTSEPRAPFAHVTNGNDDGGEQNAEPGQKAGKARADGRANLASPLRPRPKVNNDSHENTSEEMRQCALTDPLRFSFGDHFMAGQTLEEKMARLEQEGTSTTVLATAMEQLDAVKNYIAGTPMGPTLLDTVVNPDDIQMARDQMTEVLFGDANIVKLLAGLFENYPIVYIGENHKRGITSADFARYAAAAGAQVVYYECHNSSEVDDQGNVVSSRETVEQFFNLINEWDGKDTIEVFLRKKFKIRSGNLPPALDDVRRRVEHGRYDEYRQLRQAGLLIRPVEGSNKLTDPILAANYGWREEISEVERRNINAVRIASTLDFAANIAGKFKPGEKAVVICGMAHVSGTHHNDPELDGAEKLLLNNIFPGPVFSDTTEEYVNYSKLNEVSCKHVIKTNFELFYDYRDDIAEHAQNDEQ